MATLFINPSKSRCGACNKNADPYEDAHIMESMVGDGCGAVFDKLSTDYVNYHELYESIQRMRPDLPFEEFAWGS